MRNPKADWVFGKIFLHGWKGETLEMNGDPLYERHIRKTMPSIYQVTALARREVFEKFGLFRTEYKIASDYDWFLRITREGAVGRYDPRIVSHMGAGGVSTHSQRRALSEGFLICVRNGFSLWRAVAHWGLRWTYPNGAPQHVIRYIARARSIAGIPAVVVRRAAQLGRRGRSALGRRLRWLPIRALRSSRFDGRTGQPPTATIDARMLLSAFLEARQLGTGLDEAMLVSLGEIACQFPRHTVLGGGIRFVQAAIMLKTSSAPTSPADADLLVVTMSSVVQQIPAPARQDDARAGRIDDHGLHVPPERRPAGHDWPVPRGRG